MSIDQKQLEIIRYMKNHGFNIDSSIVGAPQEFIFIIAKKDNDSNHISLLDKLNFVEEYIKTETKNAIKEYKQLEREIKKNLDQMFESDNKIKKIIIGGETDEDEEEENEEEDDDEEENEEEDDEEEENEEEENEEDDDEEEDEDEEDEEENDEEEDNDEDEETDEEEDNDEDEETDEDEEEKTNNKLKIKHNHCKYTMLNFIVLLIFSSITFGLLNSKINCV